jgi:ABC-2 type transport system permease protein
MLLSQFAGSARAASGVGAAVLTVLYVATNVAETGVPAAVVGFVSPFHLANQSRALVPGYGLDLRATIALLALSGVLLGLAAWAFARRDYASPLWVRRNRARSEVAGPGPGRVPRVMLGSVWAAALRRGWVGLTFWVLCAGAFAAMYAGLQPTVLNMWDEFHFIEAMTGSMGATSVEEAYWSFCGEMVTPVIAAYVITQAAGWVADLAQGRVEMITSTPVSWAMLVRGRLIATIIGVAAIIAGTLVGLGAGAVAVGSPIAPVGAARLLLVGVLLGAALAGVAGLAVAVVRRSAAVTVLAVIVAAMYLVSYLVPLFDWPDWLNRLSVFWAFGHPYLQWPSIGRLVVLVVLAVGGTVAAAVVSERSAKVAP